MIHDRGVTVIMELKTPDHFIMDRYKAIPRRVLAAFLSAFICGIAAHLYQFTNKLYNYDELVNTPGGYGIGAELGRWFLKIMGDCNSRLFGGSYSFPMWNGMVSIFLLALSAALVVRMFQIQSLTLSVLVGAYITVFPAVVCMFYFMFTAVFYSVGIFLSILTAYLVVRFPKNVFAHIAAVVLLACSLGTYQAYFTNTVCLLLIDFILLCAFGEGNPSFKKLLLTGVRYVAVLAAGLILYLLLNRMFLAIWNIAMMDYQGISTLGQIMPGKLLASVNACYQSFFAVISENVKYLTPTNLLRKCLTIVLFVQAFSVVIFLVKGRTHAAGKILMFLAGALFPAALFLIYIMAPGSWVYAIMLYSVVFLFVFPVVWMDRFTVCMSGYERVKRGMQWVLLLLSVAMIAVYIWYANACYMSQEYTKYHDLAYCETIITQIKSVEGYTDDLPVALIGNGEVEDKTNSLGGLLENIVLQDGRMGSNVGNSSSVHLITKYLGFNPEFCGYEETKKLMDTEEVKEMPCYPDDGAIRVIDGIVVVKMSEYE